MESADPIFLNVGAMDDRFVSAYVGVMHGEESLFDKDDAAAEAAADARADADVKAGRLISHEAIKRWIGSWGSPSPLSRPKIGD